MSVAKAGEFRPAGTSRQDALWRTDTAHELLDDLGAEILEKRRTTTNGSSNSWKLEIYIGSVFKIDASARPKGWLSIIITPIRVASSKVVTWIDEVQFCQPGRRRA